MTNLINNDILIIIKWRERVKSYSVKWGLSGGNWSTAAWPNLCHLLTKNNLAIELNIYRSYNEPMRILFILPFLLLVLSCLPVPAKVLIGSFDAIRPAHLSDVSAPNDSIYYSTDQSKVVYKDSEGKVNLLY